MGNKYLQHARAIGELILDDIKYDDHGAFWETYDIHHGEIMSEVHYGIYSGSAGILLFLVELYHQTKDEKYLSYIQAGAVRLSKTAEDVHNASFFEGILGVSYVLYRGWEITSDIQLLNRADSFISDLDFESYDWNKNCDLLAGTAGALKGLMLIYDIRPSRLLIERIKKLVKVLIENAQIGISGLYWNQNGNQINGLCGMSHGSCGIGTVLAEVGLYFGCENLLLFSELSFNYEDSFFDRTNSNWPDLRHGIYSEADLEIHRKAIQTDNFSFFEIPTKNMKAWCHGSPGAVLARLSLLNIGFNLHSPSFGLVLQALNQLIEDEGYYDGESSFTICHGRSGAALAFLEAAKYTKDCVFKEAAEKIADEAVNSFEKYGYYVSGLNSRPLQDHSFFNGTSGIGYLFLLIADQEIRQNILLPVKPKNTDVGDILSANEIMHSFLNGIMPKSYNFLNDLGSPITIVPSETLSISKKDIFKLYFSVKGCLKADEAKRLEDLVKLELKLLKDTLNIKSFSFVKAHRLLTGTKKPNFERYIYDKKLQISPLVSTCITKWNWDLPAIENLELPSDEHHVLLFKTEFGSRYIYTSAIVQDMLQLCESQKGYVELMDDLRELYSLTDQDPAISILKQQLEELCEAQILIPVKI